MLQVQFPDNSHFNESQIYEDLSQIIKAFKSILIVMDKVACNLQKFQPTTNLIEQLKQIQKGLQGFIKTYSNPVDQNLQHKNTFHRFICRLIECISAYKLKLQNLSYNSILAQQIKQIQKVVMSSQQDWSVGTIIKKLQIIVNKFCSKTLNISAFNYKSEISRDQYSNTNKQSESTKVTYDYGESNGTNDNFSITINQIKPKTIPQSRYDSSLNRVMNLLNRKYRTLACLDPQYHHFKQTFFRSRGNKEELYDDCFERNASIYKEILRYSRQFSDYLQKRELKLFRKNKFVDPLIQVKFKSGVASLKTDKAESGNYNFTKKKIMNNNYESKKPNYEFNASETIDQRHPAMLVKSQIVNEKKQEKINQPNQPFIFSILTPELVDEKRKHHFFPFMTSNHTQDQKEKNFIPEDTFLDLSKRKKNLQLKKIDISLTTFNIATTTEINSAKFKNRLINPESFKKSTVQTSKQMEQRINASIRKNYLQKKYDQAMKKNFNECPIQFQQEQNQDETVPRQISSTKCIEIEQLQLLKTKNNPRKHILKTSNKRSINLGMQYKSMNPANEGRQISPIKTLKNVKTSNVENISRLQKIKQSAISQLQLTSGSSSIKPMIINQKLSMAFNSHTEITEDDFSDFNLNLGSQKQLET